MTVRDTLTKALRLTGATMLGETPGADEMDVALVDFQAMLHALPRAPLTDVLISANYTAGENERITDSSGSAVITRPTTVVDAVTSATRAPVNGAVIEVASATAPTSHIYITRLKSWMRFSALVLDDEQPFGPEHDEGLAAMLAVRLFPSLQQDLARQPSSTLMQMAGQGRQALRQRFRQPFAAITDPLLLSWSQRHGSTL